MDIKLQTLQEHFDRSINQQAVKHDRDIKRMKQELDQANAHIQSLDDEYHERVEKSLSYHFKALTRGQDSSK